MKEEWNIKKRADCCAASGRQFEDGEEFYTLLYRTPEGFRREDLSLEAWEARNDNIQPFSFWKTKFEAPPPPEPEPAPKETSETLLRRLVEEDDPATREARYILAAMLERRRILKLRERQRAEERDFLVYEYAGSGEVFLIEDPHVKLEEIPRVQAEVAALLNARMPV